MEKALECDNNLLRQLPLLPDIHLAPHLLVDSSLQFAHMGRVWLTVQDPRVHSHRKHRLL